MAAFPDFYNPERIGTLFYPDVATIAADAAAAGHARGRRGGRRTSTC